MWSTTRIRAFLKAMPQPVWVALYVHAMALSERTEWAIFRKVKGEIVLCQVLERVNGESANQL